MLTQRSFDLALKRLFKGRVPRRGVVACSGGLDSMVLLDLLSKHFSKVSGGELIVCYVDHGQRPKSEIDQDKQVIARACKASRLKLVVRQLDLPNQASELALRVARYNELKAAAPQGAVVFTAHHAQDNLETFLMRLLRGAHPDTLKGIPARAKRQGLRLARPLLEFSRQEIEAYAKQHSLGWHEDSTNQTLSYERNRIRHRLVPLLNELRPNSPTRILTFFTTLAKDQERATPQDVSKTRSLLDSQEGADVRQFNFAELKSAVDQLLGKESCRTTQSHWNNVKKQLRDRKLTRHGTGPEKTLQFPGGNALRFKGNRAYWIRNS